MDKLSLNVQKNKLMIFHRRQKQINELNISMSLTLNELDHLIFWAHAFMKACLGEHILILLGIKFLR